MKNRLIEPMAHVLPRDKRFWLALTLLLCAGCASVRGTESSATEPALEARCQLNASQLQVVKIRALNYLVKEWPVLDDRCERISDTVVNFGPSECSIIGGPIEPDQSCDSPSHKGYRIVFVEETLEPTGIYWLADQQLESYWQDLDKN